VNSFQAGGDGREALEFYKEHRAEMDEGAVCGWEHKFKPPKEISALQSCMNCRIDKPSTFAAEWQNDPEERAALGGECKQIRADDLAGKLDTREIGTAPRNTQTITAFVDLHDEVLIWMLVGWTPAFGGGIIEYGAFPQQRLPIFTVADPSPKLSDVFPRLERDARIYSGLCQLVPLLFQQSFPVVDAMPMNLSSCQIDSGYATDAVHDFIARSPLKSMLRASKGKSIGSDVRPMNTWRREPGDRVGQNWRIDARTTSKGRFVLYDTNAWKSFVAEGLIAEPGSPGAIFIPGTDPRKHELLFQHLTAEYRVRPAIVEVWKMRPGQSENHWLDCIVGAAVAASMAGLIYSAPGNLGEPPMPKPVVRKKSIVASYNEAQARKQLAGTSHAS
jgi:hypothetical protein